MTGKISLRGTFTEDRFRSAVRRVLGVDVPGKPMTCSDEGAVKCLWLRPDAWLIVTSHERTDDYMDRLKQELASHHVSVVDVSYATAVIRVTGEQASDLLMKGGTIDFHPAAFAVGKVVQASFIELSCIYHKLADGPDMYDLYLPSSYGEFVWDWLADALSKMR